MSVSFMWEVVKPSKAQCFRHGTSSDTDALRATFGDFVKSSDLYALHAMHRVTGQKESLWNDIAETIERLGGDDGTTEVKLRIWTEY